MSCRIMGQIFNTIWERDVKLYFLKIAFTIIFLCSASSAQLNMRFDWQKRVCVGGGHGDDGMLYKFSIVGVFFSVNAFVSLWIEGRGITCLYLSSGIVLSSCSMCACEHVGAWVCATTLQLGRPSQFSVIGFSVSLCWVLIVVLFCFHSEKHCCWILIM